MDINNSANVLGSLLGLDPTRAAQKTQSAQAVTATSSTAASTGTDFDSDQAQLSTAGSLAATASPDVRTEKVAAIQTAIASGNYNVSASAIASKMVASMLGE
jgi:negative regulator of flagellin synthesis FlgM